MSQIHKLYLSNFLTGLVFWYGIEKLFMRSIGIDALAIGTLTVIVATFNLIFDIPAGMLADKWSRKYILVLAALSLGICSVLLGSSYSFGLYAVGYIFYGIYIVATSGTYQAIMYDSLREIGKEKFYSKINGRAYALFLSGAGVANIASGFLSHFFGYRFNFYVTALSCLINIVVMNTLVEPAFHKPENKQRIVKDISESVRTILKLRTLTVLAVIISMLTFVEIFKGDFGQLYLLRYVSSPELLGILWAAYAFTWAIGGLIAHRFDNKINLLILCSTIPYIIMAFVDKWPAIVLFSFQAIAVAALTIQIDSRIQAATPSHVRASITSVLASVGRVVAIPSSILLGLIFRDHGAFVAVRVVAIVSAIILLVWYIAGSKRQATVTN